MPPQLPPPLVEVLARELGEVRWTPPASLIKRVDRERQRKFVNSMLFGVLALALIVASGAVTVFGPGSYAFATVFSGAAVLCFAASLLLTRAARRVPAYPLAVFEEGVFVPATFENLPGIQKFGAARAMRKSKIARVEDVRRDEGRAILLWTRTGTGGGVVSSRIGDVDMTPEEQEEVFDGFLAALEAIGVGAKGEEKAASPAATGEPQGKLQD